MPSMTETDVVSYSRERPGMSAFVLEDGVVYQTYSTYARGVDAVWEGQEVEFLHLAAAICGVSSPIFPE